MAANTEPSTKEQRPSLLTIPGEVRNRIYRLAVRKVGAVAVSTHGRKDNTLGQSPLLQVCKQLRREALSIYFEENNFLITLEAMNIKAIEAFTRLVGPSASYITSIKVYIRADSQSGPARFTATLEKEGTGEGKVVKLCWSNGQKITRGELDDVVLRSAHRLACAWTRHWVRQLDGICAPHGDEAKSGTTLLRFLKAYCRVWEWDRQNTKRQRAMTTYDPCATCKNSSLTR